MSAYSQASWCRRRPPTWCGNQRRPRSPRDTWAGGRGLRSAMAPVILAAASDVGDDIATQGVRSRRVSWFRMRGCSPPRSRSRPPTSPSTRCHSSISGGSLRRCLRAAGAQVTCMSVRACRLVAALSADMESGDSPTRFSAVPTMHAAVIAHMRGDDGTSGAVPEHTLRFIRAAPPPSPPSTPTRSPPPSASRGLHLLDE